MRDSARQVSRRQQGRARPQQGKPQRPRVEYKTPGRQCAHADKGCCPRCEKPMRVNIVRNFTLESVAHS